MLKIRPEFGFEVGEDCASLGAPPEFVGECQNIGMNL